MSPTPLNGGVVPPLGADCLSDQRLDAKVAGETLGGPERQHLGTCERCTRRLVLFEATRTTEAGNVARLVAAAAKRRPPERQSLFRPVWLGASASATVAAAAVLIFVLYGPPPADDDSIRFKGTSMRFVVQRDGRVFPGVAGDAYRTGDALRFIVTLSEPRYLLLIGMEPDGKVAAYFPFHGNASERLPAGVDQALPGSLVLDLSSGSESFVGLFSATPLTFAEVELAVTAARAAHPEGPSYLDGLPAGTTQQWVVLRRE
jgi:hypothetical protein